MRKIILGALALSAAGLLAACDGVSGDGDGQPLTAGASLCPGGSHCPREQEFVGLLLPSDSFELTGTSGPAPTAATSPASTGSTAEAPATSAEAKAEGSAQPRVATVGNKKFCPKKNDKKCKDKESGIAWDTPAAQITCNGTDCRDEDDKVVELVTSAGEPVGKDYIGWLCDTRKGDCSALPQP